ncbi:uncharacterized protein CELE_T17A3.12 [Caenorhabditis elegans]|uniref:Uncharacterized protein n=1 Tax=Caenorhabditis elegans TaxID=6239 RepID=Q8MXF8_CAEEL|nr:Uncharacterized protein CELE_T17A3.12 [Caenorhabditis elegans]CCD66083.1 Uncharacterized protein CELE_T17A3.12 [Caenorhabditis elegans]|eukprot:NP_741065.1 Uncharacterized protein CELE_T17A3.12 [Caenorhabditis elegans]
MQPLRLLFYVMSVKPYLLCNYLFGCSSRLVNRRVLNVFLQCSD